MAILGIQLWKWALGLAGAGLAVLLVLARGKLKGLLGAMRWWLAGFAILLLAWLFLGLLARRYPIEVLHRTRVPPQFWRGYWTWMYALLLGAGLGGAYTVSRLIASRRREPPAAGGVAFPDLEAAWGEFLLRLDQARIDPASQRFYPMLTPDPGAAQAFLESAGLQVFARGPDGVAPLRGIAVADGIFIDLSGCSNLGRQGDPAAGARLEWVARRLHDLNSDSPVVRGVVTLLPMGWCARPESAREAAAVRDDLQAITRILGVQPPVFAVFIGMEATPGFAEFADRLAAQVSPQMLDQRVGFSIPADREFSGDLIQQGLTWQSGWFHTWALNLLARSPEAAAGNADLVTLDSEFRRYRPRLRSVLEAAFSTHKDVEPVFLRGCYWVATGVNGRERAFSAGLVRGPRSRIVADHLMADWSEEAIRADRHYARAAAVVALVGGLLCLAVWVAIAGRYPMLGWGGLGAVAATWVACLAWLRRR